MKVRIIVGISALVCGSICGLIASLVNLEMMDKVNETLPTEKQFYPLGWHWSKTQAVHRQYKALYPAAPLLLKFRVCVAIAFACLLILASSLGVFGR